MKVLWLCNMVPGLVQQAMTGGFGNGLWVDHALQDLLDAGTVQLYVLCPGSGGDAGQVNPKLCYSTFVLEKPHKYAKKQEARFARVLSDFQPDVIHIWGTEFSHTLAMVNAAHSVHLENRVVISIQGLCTFIAEHYLEGIPETVCRHFTLRDFLKQDNLIQQRRKFALRGKLEAEALRKVRHVMGRTQWDKACTALLNPQRIYHHCGETLREPFYSGQWVYENCRKHSILAPNCYYPVKGFHYLLEAFAIVKKNYPDASLSVPGRGFLPKTWQKKLLQDGYRKYMASLVQKYDLVDSVHFLGSLDAQGMKDAYLSANVFALPSTIENSSNSLGEAMLLGVPCVAADVGGVSSMMCHGDEGYIYQPTAAYMLAYYIQKIFAMEDMAAELGWYAYDHAAYTHDPEANRKALLGIYEEISKGDDTHGNQ